MFSGEINIMRCIETLVMTIIIINDYPHHAHINYNTHFRRIPKQEAYIFFYCIVMDH